MVYISVVPSGMSTLSWKEPVNSLLSTLTDTPPSVWTGFMSLYLRKYDILYLVLGLSFIPWSLNLSIA